MKEKLKKASEALAKNQPERARRLLNQILRTDKNNIEGLWIMARLQESRGEMSAWIHTLNQLKNLLPGELGIVDELARAYAKTKRLSDSASLYREFLRQQPDSVNARYNYAYYLSRGGEYDESVKEYELLLEKDIENPEEVHLNLAKIYSERFYKYQLSLKHLNHAIKLKPDYIEAWFNLGNLNEQLGDLIEAKTCFSKVLDLGDENGAALARIADLERFEDGDKELISRMQRKLDASSDANPDLMFSLGRAYEQAGEYKKSLGLYQSANSIDWQYLPLYNRPLMVKIVDKIRQEYVIELDDMSEHIDLGQVFICGNFRSGSTLLEQMLAGHSSFTPGGERDFFRKIAIDPRLGFPSTQLFDLALREQIAEQYNQETLEFFGSGVRVTDKRPDNLLLVGLIKRVFPNVKFIITQRNTLDVAWSIFSTRFGPDLPYATKMEDILHYLKLQGELENHWSEVFKEDVMFVSYEKMIDDPRLELTKVLTGLGESWEDACLDFQTQKNHVTTASSVQVRRSLNDRSIGRAEPFRDYIKRAAEKIELSLKD